MQAEPRKSTATSAWGTGTASSAGTINMTGGTFNVTGNLTTGVGGGTLYVDGGTMSVTGDLSADVARVGREGRTAFLAAGGIVTIASSGDLDIGRNETDNVNNTTGTLNLGGADSVAISLDNLRLGTMYNGSLQRNVEGTLSLSDSGANTINAGTITIGDTISGHSPIVHGTLHLKAHNTINTDKMYVGRQKASGDVDMTAGGELTLTGLSGAEADLYIGYCDNTTGSTLNSGTVNLTGGTFDATLDELVIGYHLYPWNHTLSGSGTGTLSFDAGTVTANSVTIGSGGIQPPGTYGGKILSRPGRRTRRGYP